MSYIDILIGLGNINPAGWFLQCLMIQYIGLFIGKKAYVIILFNFMGGAIYTIITGSVMTLSWINFPLGVLFARYSDRIKIPNFTLIIFLVSYMVFLCVGKVNTIPLLINFLVMLLTFTMSFMVWKVAKSTLLVYLGKNSINLYLIHFFVLNVIRDNLHAHIIVDL